MADWQMTLDLKDVWEQAENDATSLRELAAVIAKRLNKLDLSAMPDWVCNDHLNIVEQFQELADDPEPLVTEIDGVMSDLYDWGDISLDGKFGGKKVCFIHVF